MLPSVRNLPAPPSRALRLARHLLPTMSAKEEYRVKELNTSGGANRFKVRLSS